MRRIITAISIVASLALVAAGCGSATNDYRSKVSEIQNKYSKQMTDLTSKATGAIAADPAAAGATLGELAVTVGKFADEVEAVKAPSDKQALAEKLVGAYRKLAQAATDLQTAVTKNDVTAMQTALEEFNAATSEESSAIDAFNAAE